MKFTEKKNLAVAIAAVLGAFTAAYGLGQEVWFPIVAAAIAVIQGVCQLRAHRRNPDGEDVSEPYTPAKLKKKLLTR